MNRWPRLFNVSVSSNSGWWCHSKGMPPRRRRSRRAIDERASIRTVSKADFIGMRRSCENERQNSIREGHPDTPWVFAASLTFGSRDPMLEHTLKANQANAPHRQKIIDAKRKL